MLIFVDEFNFAEVDDKEMLKTFLAGEETCLDQKHKSHQLVRLNTMVIFLTNIEPTFLRKGHADYVAGMEERIIDIHADSQTPEAALLAPKQKQMSKSKSKRADLFQVDNDDRSRSSETSGCFSPGSSNSSPYNDPNEDSDTKKKHYLEKKKAKLARQAAVLQGQLRGEELRYQSMYGSLAHSNILFIFYYFNFF
jgi:hypothetical protein